MKDAQKFPADHYIYYVVGSSYDYGHHILFKTKDKRSATREAASLRYFSKRKGYSGKLSVLSQFNVVSKYEYDTGGLKPRKSLPSGDRMEKDVIKLLDGTIYTVSKAISLEHKRLIGDGPDLKASEKTALKYATPQQKRTLATYKELYNSGRITKKKYERMFFYLLTDILTENRKREKQALL